MTAEEIAADRQWEAEADARLARVREIVNSGLAEIDAKRAAAEPLEKPIPAPPDEAGNA